MPLRAIARDGVWIVFNEPALRDAVIQYLFRPGFSPNRNQLYSRSDVNRGPRNLETQSTHWQVQQTRTQGGSNPFRYLRPGVQTTLNQLRERTSRNPQRPIWVPANIWNQFLGERNGVFAYFRESRFDTDIVLIKRMGRIRGGYAEAPTNFHRN
ncbi:MAG: hypothetical protein AB8B55_00815 [Mariniblastus sp.]